MVYKKYAPTHWCADMCIDTRYFTNSLVWWYVHRYYKIHQLIDYYHWILWFNYNNDMAQIQCRYFALYLICVLVHIHIIETTCLIIINVIRIWKPTMDPLFSLIMGWIPLNQIWCWCFVKNPCQNALTQGLYCLSTRSNCRRKRQKNTLLYEKFGLKHKT